jgi:signal transduction histidine kinase
MARHQGDQEQQSERSAKQRSAGWHPGRQHSRARRTKTRRSGSGAFIGARSLELMIIVRILACIVLAAAAAWLVVAILSKIGIVGYQNRWAISVPVTVFVLATIIAFVVIAIMARRILRPIRELRDAMGSVARGDFSVRIDDGGANNELGALIRGYNQMADELSSIEIMRDDFVDDFSHQFKTPIVSIRGFARQIERDPEVPERDQMYAHVIVDQANSLVTMASNVLTLNRYESQRMVSGQHVYDLDEQLRQCMLMLQSSWEARSIEFDLNLEPTKVWANEDLLSQAWVNLLDNAIKYSPQGGRISVTCFGIAQGETDGEIRRRIISGSQPPRDSADSTTGQATAACRVAKDSFPAGEATADRAVGKPATPKVAASAEADDEIAEESTSEVADKVANKVAEVAPLATHVATTLDTTPASASAAISAQPSATLSDATPVATSDLTPAQVPATSPATVSYRARVIIRDEGPGMDEETLRRAFDRFYRGSATAASTQGSGLGLSIVARVIELSAGKIVIRTEPGRGTEVIVTLPSADPHADFMPTAPATR